MKYYKVKEIQHSDDKHDLTIFHTWTQQELDSYLQSMQDDVEKLFYTYTVKRENEKVTIDIYI